MSTLEPKATADRAPRRQQQLLALLRQTTDTWMTTSDIAIWLYGDDDRDRCEAARELLIRLQRNGHEIAWRQATWEHPSYRATRAYRLIEAVQEAVA